MSFKDCIETANKTGKLSDNKAAEAFDTYEKAVELGIRSGVLEGQLDTWAAFKVVESVTELKGTRRWQRINQMRRGHEIYSRLMATDNPIRELDRLIEDMEYSFRSVQSVALANIDRMLSAYEPKAWGLLNPVHGLDDIVRASYGDDAPGVAKELYNSLENMFKSLRDMANMYGANIQDSGKFRLPQSHDSSLVGGVPVKEWVDDNIDRLDWDAMEYAGKFIEEDDRRAVLEQVYWSIVTDGNAKGLEGRGPSSLANRLNRERFLYYKDSKAWLEMQQKYSGGSLFSQVINMVDSMAKDISILRTFGPAPDSMREFAFRAAAHRGALLDMEAPEGKRNNAKDVEGYGEFRKQYDLHARHIPSMDSHVGLNTWATVRTIATNALLGAALISNLPTDLAMSKMARKMYGLKRAGVFRNYFSELVASPESRRAVGRAGVIMENSISLAHNMIRYFGAQEGPRFARRISDITYRVGLSAYHTQIGRNAAGKGLMGEFAEQSRLPFDDTSFAAVMAEQGITPEDWDILRRSPAAVQNIRGLSFISPAQLFLTAETPREREAAFKFSNMLQRFIQMSIPDRSLRSRVAAGEAYAPNTAMGQFIRTSTSLLSFPIALHYNQLRAITEVPGIRNKVTLTAEYMAWMMGAGIFITQAKAFFNGQQLHDMRLTDDEGNFNYDFWGRAIVNGGSLGILGDLVFDNLGLVNQSSYRAGTPTEEYFKKAKRVVTELQKGAFNGDWDGLDKASLQFLDANVPDIFYTKLILNRTIMDRLMQDADPAAYSRKLRFMREHEEGMWWEPGEEPEEIRPETVVGG